MIKLFRIDEDGVTSYMAAHNHGEALAAFIALQGGDSDAEEFTVALIPDGEVPNFRVEQSAEDDRGDFLLVEMLAKAREAGKVELLCSTEF